MPRYESTVVRVIGALGTLALWAASAPGLSRWVAALAASLSLFTTFVAARWRVTATLALVLAALVTAPLTTGDLGLAGVVLLLAATYALHTRASFGRIVTSLVILASAGLLLRGLQSLWPTLADTRSPLLALSFAVAALTVAVGLLLARRAWTRFARALGVTLVLMLAGPVAYAQEDGGPPTALETLDADKLVANESRTATAWVRTDRPTTAEVVFTWADGTPLASGGAEPTQVRSVLPEAGRYPLSVAFTPSFAREGKQTIRASLTAAGDGDIRNKTLDLSVFISRVDLEVSATNLTGSAIEANATTFITIAVTNRGNAPETPALVITPGPDWHARAPSHFPTIPPSATRLVHVLLNTSRADTPLDGHFVVHSSLSAARSVNGSFTSPPALHRADPPSVRFGLDRAEHQIHAPELLAIPFTLNSSSTSPIVLELNVTFIDGLTPWPVNVTTLKPQGVVAQIAGTRLTVPLAAGLTAELRLDIERPADSPAIVRTLEVSAMAAGSPRLNTSAVSIRLVPAGPDLAAGTLQAPSPIYRGDRAAVALMVNNLGRVPSNASVVRFDARDDLRTVATKEVEIPPLQAGGSHVATWHLDTSLLQGPYDLSATIVTGSTDRNATNGNASLSIVVRAPTLSLRAPDAILLRPNQSYVLESPHSPISVTHDGDGTENILIELSSPIPWLNTSTRVNVERDQAVPARLHIDVPASPHLTWVNVTVSASIQQRPGWRVERTIEFRIIDDAAPDVTAIPSPGVVAGEPTTLRIRAVDATGVASAELIILDPSGMRTSHSMRPSQNGDDIWQLDWTPSTPGLHSFEFRVEDSARPSHLTRLTNVTQVVLARAFHGVTPANFGTTPTRNLTLRFDEIEPGSTARMTWVRAEGNETLSSPFALTLAPVDGLTEIRLHAQSFDGATWEGRWSVMLDLTPPTISAADARLEVDRLVLSASAEGASSVVARFRAQGEVEVPLARQGDTFRAEIPRPADVREIRFVARDEAGNEGSFVLEISRDGIPFAPAWMPLLIASLALARPIHTNAPRIGSTARRVSQEFSKNPREF